MDIDFIVEHSVTNKWKSLADLHIKTDIARIFCGETLLFCRILLLNSPGSYGIVKALLLLLLYSFSLEYVSLTRKSRRVTEIEKLCVDFFFIDTSSSDIQFHELYKADTK